MNYAINRRWAGTGARRKGRRGPGAAGGHRAPAQLLARVPGSGPSRVRARACVDARGRGPGRSRVQACTREKAIQHLPASSGTIRVAGFKGP